MAFIKCSKCTILKLTLKVRQKCSFLLLPSNQECPKQLIVADRKHASAYSPVAFRPVHTGIEPPFLLKIYYAITACMTQGFTSRKY